MSAQRDKYGLSSLLDMVVHMDGNAGFDAISRHLKWAIGKASEYIDAEERDEAVSALKRARARLIKDGKVEVNTGLTKMNKMPRVTLNLLSPKAAKLTSNLGQSYLDMFRFVLANLAPTKVLIGEDRENGIVVIVIDDIHAEEMRVVDLLGHHHRVSIRVPAIDLAGHGTLATGADHRVGHVVWELDDIGMTGFSPLCENSLRNATYQVFTESGWSPSSTRFMDKVRDITKLRVIYRELPDATFDRHTEPPEWIPDLFQNLDRFAEPQLMNPDRLHPGEESVYQFSGGIEQFGARSQLVMYAGKSTTIPRKGEQSVTQLIFHPALGTGRAEYTISEEKLRLRLRLQQNVRRLIPRPLKYTPVPEARLVTPEEDTPNVDATEMPPQELESANEIQIGLTFKVPDEDSNMHDIGRGGTEVDAQDSSFLGIRAEITDAVIEGSGELTVSYHLTVRQEKMLHTNPGMLIAAHQRADSTDRKIARFLFANSPVKGGPRDLRDFKINLMKGREITVLVTYERPFPSAVKDEGP